jgi:hypothetical protein
MSAQLKLKTVQMLQEEDPQEEVQKGEVEGEGERGEGQKGGRRSIRAEMNNYRLRTAATSWGEEKLKHN